MACSKTIITVGLDLENRLPDLLPLMKAAGFHAVAADSPAEVLTSLDRQRDAVVVVYNPAKQRTAHEILQAIARRKRRTPVIVIVDQSDLDEYYELMYEGAFDYFELGGDPRWVERSVRSAVRLAA